MSHGGKRLNAGRKSKADEQKLVERLSPLENSAFTALKRALDKQESWAVKLFFEYYFGKPKEIKDKNDNIIDIPSLEVKIIK